MAGWVLGEAQAGGFRAWAVDHVDGPHLILEHQPTGRRRERIVAWHLLDDAPALEGLLDAMLDELKADLERGT